MIEQVTFFPFGGTAFGYSNGLVLSIAPAEQFSSNDEAQRILEKRRTIPAAEIGYIEADHIFVGVRRMATGGIDFLTDRFVPDPVFMGTARVPVGALPALMEAVDAAPERVALPQTTDRMRFRASPFPSFQILFANGMTLSVIPNQDPDMIEPGSIVASITLPANRLPAITVERVEVAAFVTDVAVRGNWLTGLVVPDEYREDDPIDQQVAVMPADSLRAVVRTVASMVLDDIPISG